MSIQEIYDQLHADNEATDSFLCAALARGDTNAVSIWQETLQAGKAAQNAVEAYLKVLSK
jgi:hypothetical protein